MSSVIFSSAIGQVPREWRLQSRVPATLITFRVLGSWKISSSEVEAERNMQMIVLSPGRAEKNDWIESYPFAYRHILYSNSSKYPTSSSLRPERQSQRLEQIRNRLRGPVRMLGFGERAQPTFRYLSIELLGASFPSDHHHVLTGVMSW